MRAEGPRKQPRLHRCPHCGAEGLRNLDVRWSYRETPAKCAKCGKLSHVLGSTSNAIAGMDMVLTALAVAAGMVLGSWPVGVSGVALAIAHNVWAWRRVELFPISEEAARTAAQVSWWLLGVLALLKLFSS